nr:hypothetical protein [uncultured Cohaesibacter sp.]
MGYSKSDFKHLQKQFRIMLIDDNGEPLSCQLHEHHGATGRITILSDTGHELTSHVAEACNIANVISSIDRLLSLPRSEIACEELSETVLLRLDVLREYISSAFKIASHNHYDETAADLLIRRWAGFLKHPSEFVFAHRCLSDWDIDFDKPPIIINTDFLAQWDGLKIREKDRKKSELANAIVTVDLPPIGDIEPFFSASAMHLKRLLKNTPS